MGYDSSVPEVTITLSEKEYGALCREAARRGISVGDLVVERLRELKQRRTADVMASLDKAQEQFAKNFPGMTEEEVTQVAVEEVRAYRAEQAARRHRAASSDR